MADCQSYQKRDSSTRHPFPPGTGVTEARRKRSEAKLQQCFGQPMTNSRSSDVVDAGEAYAIEEIELPSHARNATTPPPGHAGIEHSFVAARSAWWESRLCLAFVCAFVTGLVLGAGLAAVVLLTVRPGV